MKSQLSWILAIAVMAAPARAQLRLQLPALPLQSLPQPLGQIDAPSIDRLTDLRRMNIRRLIRANRRLLAADPNGEPIVRDEILALSPDAGALARALAMGFTVRRERTIGPEVRLIVLDVPAGTPTDTALRELRNADPRGTYDYNHVYSDSGGVADSPAQGTGGARGAAAADARADAGAGGAEPTPRVRVGLLDTGIDVSHPAFRGSKVHVWGCANRPLPSEHGTAVASLIVRRAAADLYAADVYCGLPTGGAVDTIVAALAWMAQEQVPVINVSLVGPKNLLLGRVIGALTARGFVIVAAVGNDGPAAPPLYPAAYPQVVGVTGVDARRHVLLEAERGPQVMFAARGADLTAADLHHGSAEVRGTSFAAPIVAALLAGALTTPNAPAATAALAHLIAQAIDLGRPGRDPIYGYGLLGSE